MTRYSAIVAGERVNVEWSQSHQHLVVRIEDRTYEFDVTTTESGVYWFEWNQKSIEATPIESGEGLIISIGGHEIPVEILDDRKALRRMGHGSHDGIATVFAPMPGRIVRVLLPEGSPVAANQGIVVMEAMKMQNEIKSPKEGRIQKLRVAEGEAVSAGDVIAQIE